MRPSVTALALVPAALFTGCIMPSAKSPSTGAVATGEPLAVVDDVKVWTTTSKEKVGETVYRDSSGRTIATADDYQERTQVHSMKIWYPVQGQQQLVDEDFFRIAGDHSALAQTEEMRSDGRKWSFRGKVMIGVGAASFIGSFFVPNIYGRTALMTGGGLAMGGGWYMAYWGASRLSPEQHAVDRSIAERAARQYNDRLGTVGASMTKSF